jgi:hypothetical protein
MAFSPIAFIAPNYSDYGTYWLKAYLPGSTTPKPLAIDLAGTTTFAKLQLNVDGFFKSAGGALITPYVEGAYDAYLFETEAEADANNTAGAIRLADNITPLVDEQLRADLAAGTVDVNLNSDLTQTYTFKTVALMKASTIAFPVGKKIFWQGYYTESDGGSNWGIVTSGTHTDDGGSIFTLADGKYVAANLKSKKLNVAKFGVTGNGVTDDTLPLANAVAFKRNLIFNTGVYLISTVNIFSDTKIKGNGKRASVFKIKSGGNTGLTYIGTAITEGQLQIEDVGFEAEVLNDGYGLTITNLAFVKTRNTRFVNLERGESFTDVLISRFVEQEYKNCQTGSWSYGVLGANINIYEHPLARGCGIGILFDSVGGETTYGNTILNGDLEYNVLALDVRECGQTPHRMINTTLEGDTATAYSNKIRVVGNGKLNFEDNLVGTFNADGNPAVFTTDSDGTINYLGLLGKQTSSLRPLIPQKGHYTGASLRIDNVLSDITYDLVKSVIKRDSVRSESSFSRNSINSFLTGSVPAGVQRVSSFENTGGWESGAFTLVASPVGDTSAFEVTTAARMSAATPQSGNACVQVFMQCTRADSGSYDISILEQASNASLSNFAVNYNGASGWQLVSITIDLATTTSGIRLVFPVLAGIRIWGQQIVTGTKYPVPILPVSAPNENGLIVNDYKSITPLYRSGYFRQENVASGVIFTTKDLVLSTDSDLGLGMAFEIITQEFFGSSSQTRKYLVNLSYSIAYTSTSISEIAHSYSGSTFSSRLDITATNVGAGANKGIKFTTNAFINNFLIKVSPLI